MSCGKEAGKRSASGNTRLIDALRIADESVVMMNLEPMNSGNRTGGENSGDTCVCKWRNRAKSFVVM